MNLRYVTILAIAILSLSIIFAGCTSPAGVIPTPTPRVIPSIAPTITPIQTPVITPVPTVLPTLTPNISPIIAPTMTPIATPRTTPIATPTQQITLKPTITPTPTIVPTVPVGPAYMQGIDNALANGPVVVEFWTSTCTYCKQQATILNDLKATVPNVNILDYDANANKDLSREFGITSVPTMSVIAKKNTDGSYTYAGPGGSITNDRFKSRFVGLTQKDALCTAINAALSNR